MAIRWPEYEKTAPDNQNDPVGTALKAMVERALPQSAANQRQLQKERAAEAKRQRAESLDAAKVLDTEYPRS